ncbi:polysaccharide pyruvyl transferase [Azorhizobium sp. AG788]|uniref:polysaccharide pyruvyl transferase family protein n=1 Tax=Azorhizobium sp. AG788 TaxID=2183897 RepID=UPI0010D37B5F|nr:polysaccharide pyruvyl transferase family protein [Azorhizobium sp. AG788]TDT93786.1 polysaccharide pyruvyl transferase [Azorhizobium sp. AG788]
MSATPAAPRRARIGVLMPAGKVMDHDRVVTHTYGNPEKATSLFTNIGDCFVFESSLRILDYADVQPIYAGENTVPSDAYVEKLNQLDFLFLRGSNYINTNGKWDAITALLERTKVPVMAFGIGVQTPDNSEEYVNESTKRFLQLVADRSTSIAIRGTLSQKALKSIGIDKVRIIGCPTAFRHRKPTISINRIASGDISNLGFTLRRKTHGSQTLQRYMLRTLAEQYKTRIFCAGELEEKQIFYAERGMLKDSGDVQANAIETLINENWFYGPRDPLIDLYKAQLAVFEAVQDFEAGLKEMDGVTGFRLHGNLLALANGVPALYVTYDTRTREFVQTLGIPSIDIKQMDRFSFQKAWDKADFGTFEKAYALRFKELKAFLEENGMAHRLERPVPKLVAAE